MTMKSLEGDLNDFPLTDIIQLVDLSKKTGAVNVHGQRGAQTLEAWIYFRDGKIIGAELGNQAPLEALYTCFTFTQGPFRFFDDLSHRQPTITASNEIIIMEGVMRRDAWMDIQQHVPSLTAVPRLEPNPSGGSEINLEADEWRVLTMVNGKNSVAQIAQRSGLGDFRTCQIIVRLLTNGLIAYRETSPAEAVLAELDRMVVHAMGANANVLLREAYGRAHIAEPAQASSEQLLAAVTELEPAAIRLMGESGARRLLNDLRDYIQEMMG